MAKKASPEAEALRDRYRGKTCVWCGLPASSQPHHIKPKGMGGGSTLDIVENVIALCLWCHGRHHSTHKPSTKELLGIKGKELGITASEVQQRIWDALRGER